jgi:hypothetical protein
MIEGKLLPILTLVEGLELGCPLDPNLVLLENVNLDVASLVLVSFGVVAPDILCTKLDAGLFGGRPDERDQRLNVDNSSKVRKSIFLQVSEVMFSSRLKLDITEVGAAVSKLLRSFARIMEDQNLSGRIAKHDRDSSWIAFLGLDLVEQRAVALGVEA